MYKTSNALTELDRLNLKEGQHFENKMAHPNNLTVAKGWFSQSNNINTNDAKGWFSRASYYEGI